MREIKYKIWDNEENKWFKPIYNAYKGELSELLLSPSGDLCWRTTNGFSHESTFKGRFTVVLYTGLKDKNGKEIYCGDIIKGYFDVDTVEDSIWLSLSEDEKKQGWRIFEIPEDIIEVTMGLLPDELEVIGDIYNNPELIK